MARRASGELTRRMVTIGTMVTSQRPRTPSRKPHTDVVTLTVNACATGALAALLGVAIALIVAVGAWALAPHGADSSPEGALRLAAGMWLLAHHVPLDLPTGSLGLTPLGLMVVPGALLFAGGRQMARTLRLANLADVVRAVIPYALTYGLTAAIVAGVAGSTSVRPHAWAAFVAGALLACAMGSLGMLRGADLTTGLWTLLPSILRHALAGAAAGLATLVAVGAAVASLALAIGFPEAVEMFRALNPDIVGGVVLALLGVAFVPNLVVWAVSFSTGVGFSLGVTGSVSPRGIEYGPLPVFPPLTAIPPEGTPGALALSALLAPLLAGVVTGWVVHRRLPRGTSEQVVARAGLAGIFCGVAVAGLCWLSAGPVASGQLSRVGPVPWQVGAVTALEVGLVAAATAWEARRRSWSGRGVINLRNRVASRGSR